MSGVGWVLAGIPVLIAAYAYVVYPGVMWVFARVRDQSPPDTSPSEWPSVTITLPVYNEEGSLAATLDNLLALDYPRDRLTILVVSDASSDRTDDIARSYASRGVQLLRLPHRAGKTAAENAAAARVTDPIMVNTDATVRVLPHGLKALVRVFQDREIGLASGRDLSVGDTERETNRAESGYVDYEMRIRSLETRADSIVGASGCWYAVRNGLLDPKFPEALSRDFASALIVVEKGYRAVSVDDAVCLVPRTRSLRAEYRRKVRTMTRGLQTLWYHRRMLSPKRPLFAFALWSHKLARWAVLLLLPLLPIGLLLLAAPNQWRVGFLLLGGAIALGLGLLGIFWRGPRKPPRPIALLGFALVSVTAGLASWLQAFRGELKPVWEPTRRR